MSNTAEQQRLAALRRNEAAWQQWGPYLSERAWGTVREDYSADGDAWRYFPHDHARSRAYRWGEDGLAGLSDERQYLCFAPAFWNGTDPILKERLFGLTGPEGNHGEDVKEYLYFVENTPTHSYMKAVYKYPQAAFPYDDLVSENARRGHDDPEYELLDTGVFNDDRYFDIVIEYAKAAPDDLLIKITAANRGPEAAECTVVPALWLRNTWSWGYENGPRDDVRRKPELWAAARDGQDTTIAADHPRLGRYTLYAEGAETVLFTENETNAERLFGEANRTPYVKDAFHRYLVDGDETAVNPEQAGTKGAFVWQLSVPGGEERAVRLRLVAGEHDAPFDDFAVLLDQRAADADAFYDAIQPDALSDDERAVQRQALAGMLWSKQLYYIDVPQWLDGDPAFPPPPASRLVGRNHDWEHLNAFDIITMPDTWEYPWFAAWDLAFHCLPLALVDAEFAKQQLITLARVWYLHPNGQLPAYEWAFGDVNPPVHAWAAWRVYQMDAATTGQPDRDFLERVFQKMLLNFTWWVNRKDEEGHNIFQGGFLGLDNISVFDRSAMLPTGGHMDQSDATAWMGFYCLTMMRIALELARENGVYQDMATKFYEHFLGIAYAMTNHSGKQFSLWDEDDGFFYDVLHLADEEMIPLRVRSLVGLMPLLAVGTLEPELLKHMPDFQRRQRWFTRHRPKLSSNMASTEVRGEGERLLVAIPTRERLLRVLSYMLDEGEFLSQYGVRSLSKHHQAEPYKIWAGGQRFSIDYEAGESRSDLFGGNSNWRGPIWFPINFLLIEALTTYHRYYGNGLKVECPTGSGVYVTLAEVAAVLTERLTGLFLRDENGRRPANGDREMLQTDPHWRDFVLFHEYFHGDTGEGLGASHQTGWTGLVANLLDMTARSRPGRPATTPGSDDGHSHY